MVEYIRDCDRYFLRIRVDDTLLGRHYAQIPKYVVEDTVRRCCKGVRKLVRKMAKESTGSRGMEIKYRHTTVRYVYRLALSAKRSCKCLPDTQDGTAILSELAKNIDHSLSEWTREREEKGGYYVRW